MWRNEFEGGKFSKTYGQLGWHRELFKSGEIGRIFPGGFDDKSEIIYCSNIIEDGCTNIDNCAFSGFSKLTSVSIPDSVTSIDYAAFARAENLHTIQISQNVTRIDLDAFEKCYSLQDIRIPLCIEKVDRNAFIDCKEDAVIHYPGTIEQWLSVTGHLEFAGTVECSDGNWRY